MSGQDDGRNMANPYQTPPNSNQAIYRHQPMSNMATNSPYIMQPGSMMQNSVEPVTPAQNVELEMGQNWGVSRF